MFVSLFPSMLQCPGTWTAVCVCVCVCVCVGWTSVCPARLLFVVQGKKRGIPTNKVHRGLHLLQSFSPPPPLLFLSCSLSSHFNLKPPIKHPHFGSFDSTLQDNKYFPAASGTCFCEFSKCGHMKHLQS